MRLNIRSFFYLNNVYKLAMVVTNFIFIHKQFVVKFSFVYCYIKFFRKNLRYTL